MKKRVLVYALLLCLLLSGCYNDSESASSINNQSSVSLTSDSTYNDKPTDLGYTVKSTIRTRADISKVAVDDAYLVEVGKNHTIYLSKSDTMKYKYQIFEKEKSIDGKTILIYESDWWYTQRPEFYYYSGYLKVKQDVNTIYFDIMNYELYKDSYKTIVHTFVHDDTIDYVSDERSLVVKDALDAVLYVTDCFTDEVYTTIPFPEGYTGSKFIGVNRLCISSEKNGKKIDTIVDIPLTGTGILFDEYFEENR